MKSTIFLGKTDSYLIFIYVSNYSSLREGKKKEGEKQKYRGENKGREEIEGGRRK